MQGQNHIKNERIMYEFLRVFFLY